MKLPGRNSRSLLITALLAGGSVAYVFFVFLPGQKAIGQLRRELDTKQQFIIDADRLAHAVQLAQRDLDSAEQFTTRWREAAPEESQLAAMLGRITAEAEAVGVSIRRLDQRDITRFESIEQVPVLLECQGDFRQVFELIRRLEAMPQDVWLSRLRIEQLGQDSEKVSAELVLEIFADNPDNSH